MMIVLSYMDTLVNRENNPYLSGTVILWNYQNTQEFERGCLKLAGSSLGEAFHLWPPVSHSEDAGTGPNLK